MRGGFFRALLKLAEKDERIQLVVGDLGFGVVEPFIERLPKQFLNSGVAEQNMTGIAAGLALSGKIVFTYSIGNFPTLRCLEQIRNDICYHNADVKVVAVGGGFAYGALGMTHHATEDLAILRALPGMTVIAPGDPIEAEEATRAIAARPGPCYLRLGRAGEKIVHQGPIEFEIGKAIVVRNGEDVTLISTGGMLETAVEVADILMREGIHARVLSMHTVKPLDSEAILSAASETRGIVTLEEHTVLGGLGSAVAELLAEEHNLHVPFKRIGLPPGFASCIGSQEYLRSCYGLSPNTIRQSLESVLELAELVGSAPKNLTATAA